MAISPLIVDRLQQDPSCIRNICILAHVDHGKTSLSDSLLASNGIISSNLAGKIRYLDSRPDEQERGITMESSAISLYFKVARRATKPEEPAQTSSEESGSSSPSQNISEYLINLIDSPGHIDFSSEVSTASRLCDGAVILVDVVEGVCSQTVTVLRQAWTEKLRPILVLNKMDRLITELRMSPLEAYLHLSRLIEQVNVVVGTLFAGEKMLEDLKSSKVEENVEHASSTTPTTDDDIYFSPELNNVIFASAIDGWGFNISQFAAIYEKKLGMNRTTLQKVLWGDYYFDPKTKRVVSGKTRNKPLFVQLVLQTIWDVYASTVIERDLIKSEKIVTTLGLKVSPRDLKSKDGRPLLDSILTQWIPVATSVLLTVIDKLPSPIEAQKLRLPSVLSTIPGGDEIPESLRDSILSCDQTGPAVAYVSKVISVPESELRQINSTRNENGNEGQRARIERARKARLLAQKTAEDTADNIINQDQEEDHITTSVATNSSNENDPSTFVNDECLIGFARIFSGSLSVGQTLTLVGPKYGTDNRIDTHITTVTISSIYLLMGRDMIPLKHAPAGNIVGIGGLDGKILKTGTLVSSSVTGHLPNFAGISSSNPPIVRVAIEPVDPTKIPELERGLRMLNLSDPSVQVMVQENGEHILMTAGELHLERCLKDLRERFAKIEIQVSQPIVPYRETVVKRSIGQDHSADNTAGITERVPLSGRESPAPGRGTPTSEKTPGQGRPFHTHDSSTVLPGIAELSIGSFSVKFSVRPLSDDLIEYLVENTNILRDNPKKSSVDHAIKEIEEILSKDTSFSPGTADKIVALGPRRFGPNILVDYSGVLIKR